MFKDKHIIVGVTGSLSAYKAAELVSRLKSLGADVRVVMTKNATEFVTPLTFKTLSQNPVASNMFAEKQDWMVEHIAWAKWADAFVVAPATANCIAKLACDIADDLLSSMFLAVRCPVFMAPAMNPLMFETVAQSGHIEKLKERGVTFLGDDECINAQPGKMASTEAILDALATALK